MPFTMPSRLSPLLYADKKAIGPRQLTEEEARDTARRAYTRNSRLGVFAQRPEKVHSSRHAERLSGNTSPEGSAYDPKQFSEPFQNTHFRNFSAVKRKPPVSACTNL